MGEFIHHTHEAPKPEQKILSYDDAAMLIQSLRALGKTVVLAQGVFDIVHNGHIEYLRHAKMGGDVLFVGIENDENVRLNKGERRPYIDAASRMDHLAEFQSVDYVFTYPDVVPYNDGEAAYMLRLKTLKPNLLAVSGYDPFIENKVERAKKIGVDILAMHAQLSNFTTRLAQKLNLEP